ncbi:hypothetical protein [Salinisphaera aquimarina]|uniref:Uncharacterized protein n=1 Tax=Salinisphaera aquimarina TaxID=2094031 RepID=A0ABV7EMQ8_9GAMM
MARLRAFHESRIAVATDAGSGIGRASVKNITVCNACQAPASAAIRS